MKFWERQYSQPYWKGNPLGKRFRWRFHWIRQGEDYYEAVQRVEQERLDLEKANETRVQRRTWASLRGYQQKNSREVPVPASPGVRVVEQRHYKRARIHV